MPGISAKFSRLRQTSSGSAFNSITKDAVLKALNDPHEIDIALVNAQQARRLLDRIVGYKISPILNRRIQRGKEGAVSAGRVQSVALKFVVDREKEIEAFKPIEYWNLAAILKTPNEKRSFTASLYASMGNGLKRNVPKAKISTSSTTKKRQTHPRKDEKKALYSLKRRKKRKATQSCSSFHHLYTSTRSKPPPWVFLCQNNEYRPRLFTKGSTLAMMDAEGLITYMRTDSVRIAPEAFEEAREYILKTYGKDFLPPQAKIYNTQKRSRCPRSDSPDNLEHPPE